jgi:polygalacturonase
MIRISSVPDQSYKSNDFFVTVNGVELDTYKCRVSRIPFNRIWPGYQRSLDQTEMASFAYLSTDEDVEVAITPNKDFKEVIVRPLSRKVKVETAGRNITLRIKETGQYTVELDGHHNALHLFINPVEEYDNDENTIYFGPGVHHAGHIEMKDNQTIYVDAGAVVHCSITATDKKNIAIKGHGILDNSTFKRPSSSCLRCPTSVAFTRCRNVEISGVIFNDASSWTATFINCDNILVDNVKTIGMWRYNSDGFDFVNSANGIVRNSFFRNFDDVIVLKGLKGYDYRNVENILVENCVLWCDWGRALEIGAETCADEYRNIVFRNCDIIHASTKAMDIQNGDRANVHMVLFEDIRVEYSKYAMPEVYQESDDMEYVWDGKPNIPWLFYAHLYCGLWSDDNLLGSNSNIRLKNIQVFMDEGLERPKIGLYGANAEHMTTNIVIEDLYINGVKVESFEDANIHINEFVKDVVVR